MLVELWEKIQPVLWTAGVHRKNLVFNPELEARQQFFLEQALEYVGTINKIKALVPQEVWDNYETIGVEGLREQVMLADAYKSFRDWWNQNYKLAFPLKEKVNAKNIEQGSEQVPAGS